MKGGATPQDLSRQAAAGRRGVASHRVASANTDEAVLRREEIDMAGREGERKNELEVFEVEVLTCSLVFVVFGCVCFPTQRT